MKRAKVESPNKDFSSVKVCILAFFFTPLGYTKSEI